MEDSRVVLGLADWYGNVPLETSPAAAQEVAGVN
jgi:hypothetical protein